MIKEISNFISGLDADMKNLGIKPKEGLHILLRIQENDGRLFMDDRSLVQVAFTRKKESLPEELAFLQRSASLSQLSWCVNTNKCFDLPVKAIHSCSPYCVAVKRENLTGGDKYNDNTQSQVYERINNYFSKASMLLINETDKQLIEIFKNAINSEEKFNYWLTLVPEYQNVKDSEYVVFYLDTSVEKYAEANAKYLSDKLFNTNDFNITVDEEVFGTSDFFNGYPSKKPFLTHQSASFDVAGRISSKEAKDLFDFEDIMSRNILPKPLPIFIHQNEIAGKNGQNLRESSIKIFKREAEEGSRISYSEILRELRETHKEELGNYYLLFYDRGTIKDFDFVSKFEYDLRDTSGDKWRISDYFNGGNAQTINDVFHFQQAVLLPIFSNGFVTKTNAGAFQYKYFEDIDRKHFKSDVTYLQVLQYRKAFYDFIYKSKRQSITNEMFHNILLNGILEDIRKDEMINGFHTRNKAVREKLNIWFSITENFFHNKNKNDVTMANKLLANQGFILKLAKGEVNISTDDEYAFTVGQVIYYLMSKSKTADRSYKRLEPFMQQVQAKEVNKAIARMFDSYKHENFSNNFKIPFSQVLAYDTKTNVRDLMPTILSGVFSTNALFSGSESKEEADTINEVEAEN